jgi:hypothetical protein
VAATKHSWLWVVAKTCTFIVAAALATVFHSILESRPMEAIIDLVN